MEITREALRKMFATMVTIRQFELRAFTEVGQRSLRGALHLSVGQEGVPTGICAHLSDADYLASTHRGHGHCIAKGVDVRGMMAEILQRSTGTNKGKGGSMHIADMSKGMLGANGVVGSSVPIAVGAAMAAKQRGSDQVAISFFGDGGANQGIVHESMNLAAIWKLPVIFVCENNQYAESTPVEYATPIADIAERARGYNMPGVVVDGMDVFAVYDAAGTAIGRARSGLGPTLLECKTYRYYGHAAFDNPKNYRTTEEEDAWKARDVLAGFRERVAAEGLLDASELDELEAEASQLVDDAVHVRRRVARAGPERTADGRVPGRVTERAGAELAPVAPPFVIPAKAGIQRGGGSEGVPVQRGGAVRPEGNRRACPVLDTGGNGGAIAPNDGSHL